MADGARPNGIDNVIGSFGIMEDDWFADRNSDPANKASNDMIYPTHTGTKRTYDIPYANKGILTQAKEVVGKAARRYDSLAGQWDSFAETTGREIAGYIAKVVGRYNNP